MCPTIEDRREWRESESCLEVSQAADPLTDKVKVLKKTPNDVTLTIPKPSNEITIEEIKERVVEMLNRDEQDPEKRVTIEGVDVIEEYEAMPSSSTGGQVLKESVKVKSTHSRNQESPKSRNAIVKIKIQNSKSVRTTLATDLCEEFKRTKNSAFKTRGLKINFGSLGLMFKTGSEDCSTARVNWVPAKALEEAEKKLETLKGCTCIDVINHDGFGRCRKQSQKLKGLYTCYVRQPSNCNDLQQSDSNPGVFYSAQACETFLKEKKTISTTRIQYQNPSAPVLRETGGRGRQFGVPQPLGGRR
jgi:hypothetical protein